MDFKFLVSTVKPGRVLVGKFGVYYSLSCIGFKTLYVSLFGIVSPLIINNSNSLPVDKYHC